MNPIPVKIKDLRPGLVAGVEVAMPEGASYSESYFEWTENPLSAAFETSEISGGVIKMWHSVPLFTEAENHIDAEMFYFASGTALMLFVDYKNGKPDPATAEVVRIQPGTRIVIAKGKGHFVPVAEDDTPAVVVVTAPKMDAPRTTLPEPIVGVV